MDLTSLATMHGVLGDSHSLIAKGLRQKLRRYGATVIYNFLDEEIRTSLLGESLVMQKDAIRYSEQYNPYNDSKESGPQVDAISFRSKFSLEICDKSRISPHSMAYKLYSLPKMTEIICSITGRHTLSHYNDPGAALNLTYMRADDAVGWHFDTCDFVVALVLQMPSAGGELIFSHRNRSAHAEHRDHIYDVLVRPSALALRIPYSEGSLVIFEGRNSLHCIRPILGSTERIVLLMSYHQTLNSNVTESLKHSRYVASHGSAQ